MTSSAPVSVISVLNVEPELDELLALTTALSVSSPLSVHDIITLLLESDETSTEPASPEVFI